MISRFIDKFENESGSLVQKFPMMDYEWETRQDFRTPFVDVSGAHYGLDLLEVGVSLKNTASERLRFTVYDRCGPLGVESRIDDMRAKLFKIGKGKLWLRNYNNERRWAWARLMGMPEYTISFDPGMFKTVPVTVEFRRQSDWRGSSLVIGSETATGTVTVNNPGNARVYDAVFQLVGTFDNPIITNNTNGYSFQSTSEGSSIADGIKIDAGAHTVEFSDDGGFVFVDDYANYERPVSQVQLMVLEPGDNEFVFEGMTSATFSWSFYGAWH